MRYQRALASSILSIGMCMFAWAIEESPVLKIEVLQTVSSSASLNAMTFPSASIAPYDNSWYSSNAIYYPGGAATSVTRSVCDDFLGTETAPFPINRYVIGIVNNNSRELTFRPKTRLWLDSGSNSPGVVFAGISPMVTISANTGQVLAVTTSIPNTPVGKKWFSVVFDKTGGDATPAELNQLGVYLFDPQRVGVSEDVLFLTSNPGDFFSSNPAGTLIDFGAAPRANMIGRFETPAPVYISGRVHLPGCAELAGRVVTVQIRELDSAQVVTESVALNSQGDFVFSTPFPNPNPSQPNINLPRVFRVYVKAPGWLGEDQTGIEIDNSGALLEDVSAGVAGDVDDSNGIDLGDFDLFATSFGSEIGNSTYLPEADFDASGSIDLGDFDSFALNFGQEGDW